MAGAGPPAPQSLAWKLWSTLVCVQLLLNMVDSAQASRMLQQQASQQRRLQAFSDDTNDPRHAPPVQSFLVSDGSLVDCIPIEGQISAHHPALTDHIIQMRPSSSCKTSDQTRGLQHHPQLFAREYGGCPEDFVPVQRADPNRLFLKKTQHSPLSIKATTGPSEATHEYAITGLPISNYSYTGAHHVFSFNDPNLGNLSTDFSLSQTWIVDGSYDDNSLSTIEVGWQKYPSADFETGGQPQAPHLFVYWTADAYNQTGCYDLSCPGFVQTSSTSVVGGGFVGGPLSNYTTLAENAQYELEAELEVLYDSTSQNWILYLDSEQVGYWPSSIYKLNGKLQGSANQVQWGGEVAFHKDAANPTVHSMTTMGSGAFPSDGYPVAAYYRNISYADAAGNFVDAVPSILDSQRSFNNPLCYNISVQQGNFLSWGTYFFFGGSGGNNPGCVGTTP